MYLLNLFVQIATVGSLLVATAAIYASVQMSRRQMNVNVFTTYAARYESIMDAFPENAFRARFNLERHLPPESDKLRLCVLRYLNMSSEEYYLWKKKYIDNEVWQTWEHEMKRTLNSPLLLREWQHITHEFDSYPEFKEFVKSAQSNAPSAPR